MYYLAKELFSLLTPAQRRNLLVLQLLVVSMAFTEIASVASIGPFMALIGDISILEGNGRLAHIFQVSGLENTSDFVFLAGIGALMVLGINAIVSAYTSWRLAIFGAQIGTEIGDRLFKYYLYRPWLFHTTTNSSHLTKQITTESSRVTGEVIQPLLLINAKIVVALSMSVAVFLFNPWIAISGMLFIVITYLIIYKLVRFKLKSSGVIFSGAIAQRFSLMSEGFGGIRDVLLLGLQENFVQRFQASGKKIAHSQGTIHAFAHLPRYFIELVAFSAVIFLVLYLVKVYQGDLGALLPVLALYALAGFKLLPAFQQIYTLSAIAKGGASAFESIKHDLRDSITSDSHDLAYKEILSVSKNIVLDNVSFTYPGKKIPAISGLNLEIPAHKVIGIVGSSGSGKSTMIDLLLGLIEPDSGYLMVDDQVITPERKRVWQNTLGFVPQTIFLSDASILENIAFGQSPEDIDIAQVEYAAKLAHLEEYIASLPDGYATRVGERGVQLSGGQRQRIGIARCLYHKAKVLILDEATSSLDGITEKLIMDAIHDLTGQKTIVMIAHRLTTVKKCDIIYFMDQGKVIDKGTYADLLLRNEQFKKMADNN